MPSTRPGGTSAIHRTYRCYKNTAAARGSNPSQLGILLPNPPPVTSRRRVRGGGRRRGVRPWERAVLRQAGAVRGGGAGPDRRHAPPSSISSAPRRRLLPAGKLAPCRFTNACTSARGHQGEPEFFPFHVDAPVIELRGKAPPFAAAHAAGDAGHRARLGKNFAGATAVIAARAAPLVFPPLFLFAL
jgi:hypothetical protein